MMKFITILFLVFQCFTSKAQISEHPFHVNLRAGFGTNTDKINYQVYSIQGEYIFKIRLGLVYNIDFIRSQDGANRFHTSAGSLGSPLLLAASIVIGSQSDSWQLASLGITGAILMFACPDGVTYHIPAGYHWDFAPYANLLGVEYIRNNYFGGSKFRWATSYGLKLTYSNMYNFTFSTFAEARQLAGRPWGFNAGVGVGYSIGNFESGWKPRLLPEKENEQ